MKARKVQTKSSQLLKVSFQGNARDILKKHAIRSFFLSDEASHPTPGKKDFVKVDGEKIQKRYLNDSMLYLYKNFIKTATLVVSYSTFCKHKPKEVVAPKIGSWDTCLCPKCQNFKLITGSLHSVQVINAKNKTEIANAVCCDSENEKCLLRSCNECKQTTLIFNDCDKNVQISYEQ